jgi:hypothetical protein
MLERMTSIVLFSNVLPCSSTSVVGEVGSHAWKPAPACWRIVFSSTLTRATGVPVQFDR